MPFASGSCKQQAKIGRQVGACSPRSLRKVVIPPAAHFARPVQSICLRKFYIPKRQHAGASRSQNERRALPEAVEFLVENTLARDVAAATFAMIGGLLLVKIFDFLSYSGTVDQKVSRKLVHILAGPGLMLCWPFYSNAPYARFFAALVPSLNVFRLLLIGTGVVKDEGTVNAVSREGDRRELLRGPLFYVLVLTAATIVYWRDSPIGITAVALMSGGDGLADLVGRRYGSVRLPHNEAKSWAGSLAMFLGGWGLAVAFIAFFQHLNLFECTLWAISGSVGAIAAAAAVFESLPVNRWLDDNLSVPVVAALLGQCLFARGALLVA